MQVVVFTRNNARILKNPANLNELSVWGNVVVDPDLSAVLPARGVNIKPMYWKRGEGKKILPMTSSEMLLREADIAQNGADNEIKEVVVPVQSFSFLRSLGLRVKRFFGLA